MQAKKGTQAAQSLRANPFGDRTKPRHHQGQGLKAGLLALSLALSGCAVMERELAEAAVPWGEVGFQSLAVVPEAEGAAAWAIAQEAARHLAAKLEATVAIGPVGHTEAKLIVQVARLDERVEAGTPRRVSTQAWPAPAHYEADALTRVQMELSGRVVDGQGQVRWATTGRGKSEQSHVVVLPYPAIESLPAPAYTPNVPPDVEVLARLRTDALTQAIRPLDEALTTRYRVKPISEAP